MLYLDFAAAAPPEPETLEYARELWEKDFANQESGHALGFGLRQKIAAAEAKLSRTFWGKEGGRAVWGASCTELFQLLAASPFVRGKRVASSVLEHPALAGALKREAGDFLPLRSDKRGQLVAEPAEKVALAAFHQVQSELGAVQDLPRLYAAFPGAVRFADAAQGAGKLGFPECDVAAVSGAKLGVPGGGAALLLNPDWKQAAEFAAFAVAYRKKEHRLSRISPAVIELFACAAERREARREQLCREMRRFNDFLRMRLEKSKLRPTLPAEFASPFILHLTAPGMQGAVLVRMLSELGVMTSSGSACAAESPDPSPALLALGYRRLDAWSGLRLSFAGVPAPDAADFLLSALEKVLQNY
jgi:cysteine desulfurase